MQEGLLWIGNCLRDAWHNHHGLSRIEAKRRYISTLIETMHQYATTTPEARELVAELEFVWDQIKSNTASSAGSSPDQIVGSQRQQVQNPSYASIGQYAKGPHGGDGALRVLRPVSDADEGEQEVEGEEFQEAHAGAYDDDDDLAVAGVEGQSRDFDIRNRKWRKRIEHALVKMTVEVAALREQVEAKRIGEGKRRNGVWAWIIWLMWVTVRHTLMDLAVLGVLVVWARRKRDRRVEVGVELLLQYLGDQVRRLLRPLRIPAQER